MLAHALGSIEQVVELFDSCIGIDVRGGWVVQNVFPVAYIYSPRHGVDIEHLPPDGILALEEL